MPVATKKQERAQEIAVRLKRAYPKAKCSLDFTNAFELLIATWLAGEPSELALARQALLRVVAEAEIPRARRRR